MTVCNLAVSPREFLSKVQKRLNISAWESNRLSVSAWEELESAGKYTEILSHKLPPNSLRQKVVKARVSDQMEWLKAVATEFENARTEAKRKPSEIRALYYVTNSLPFTNSGYSLRTARLLEAVRDLGVEVVAATRVGFPVLAGKLAPRKCDSVNGIEYRRIIPWLFAHRPSKRHDTATRELKKLAVNEKVTILHTTTDFENAIAVFRVARDLGLPWIYEVRGEREKTWLSETTLSGAARHESSDYFRLRRRLETLSAHAADAVITLSDVSKNEFIQRGIPANKIHVVPNSVSNGMFSLSFDKTSLRKELEIDEGIWVGAITAVVGYEGLETMLSALLELPEHYKFAIVGAGSAIPDLKVIAETQGLSSRVRFVGKVEHQEIWKWYAAIDMLVVPRRDDPVCRTVTPLKPMEAMAVGTPVVVSDLPALREVTGNCAFYFNAGNSGDLASRIKEVSKDLYDVESAKKWAQTRTWNAAAHTLLNVYQQLTE